MVTSRYGRTVALGLAGWLVRLLFAASAAAGIYGLYLAWFASVGQVDPGHDTVTGTAVMGIAFGVSLIAVMLIYPPALRRGAGPHWYLFTYAAFIVVFLTTVLPLHAALRTIGTWERSNTLVAAVGTGCAAWDDGNGGTYDTCDLSWSVNGRRYVQNRSVNDVYPDGTIVELWVDPHNGGADDHDWVAVMWGFIGAGAGLALDGVTLGYGAIRAREESRGLRPWLQRMAWWRDLARIENPTPPAGPEIADAIPGWANPDGVEDTKT